MQEPTPARSNALSIVAHTIRRSMMKTFEFSIIASGLDPTAEDFEKWFYDAGCDDATISFQNGHIIVDFAREAETLESAIASAVKAVKKAGAKVDRVEPDPLVTLADMAKRTGLTRAAMTNYFKGARARGFPSPVAKVTSESPLWAWPSVARWLFRRSLISRDAVLAAETFKEANKAIEQDAPNLEKRLKGHVREYAEEL
jgi:hypothetical protein